MPHLSRLTLPSSPRARPVRLALAPFVQLIRIWIRARRPRQIAELHLLGGRAAWHVVRPPCRPPPSQDLPDIAGGLLTSTYRNTKIAGKLEAGRAVETGSCFDTSKANSLRAGSHKRIAIEGPLPRWMKSTCSYELPTPVPDPGDYLKVRRCPGCRTLAWLHDAAAPVRLARRA